MSIEDINDCLQKNLIESGMDKVKVSLAAQWLDEAGLLKNNPGSPGSSLRKLIAKNSISGTKKEKNLWYIYPLKQKKRKQSTAVPSKEKDIIDPLQQCFHLLNNKRKKLKMLDSEPLDLIRQVRDATRVSLLESAINIDKDYPDSANMTDTIAFLYQKRLIDKLTVQYLHIIRKFGNLAKYENDNMQDRSKRSAAEMVCLAFLAFFEEAKNNKLIQ